MRRAIRQRLISLSEPKYRDFSSSLMPSVDKDSVLGVRIPALRAYVRELSKEDVEPFLSALPHKYFEENNLHAFLICEIRDFDACISKVEEFLPYVDNWSTCDSLRPKCFKKNAARLMPYIKKWLESDKEYTVRFGIEMLMTYFLDENFSEEHLALVAAVRREEYYVKMMVAWYFATALAKRWDSTILYVENGTFDTWVHNKTIQKARESYRITAEQKEYLQRLKKNR